MTDWVKLKVVDLKKELSSRNLPQTGLKQDLVNRLTADDEAKNAVKDNASEEVVDAPGENGEGNGGVPAGDAEISEVKEKDDFASKTIPTTRGGDLIEKDESAEEGESANVAADGLNAGSVALEGSTLIETSTEEKKPAQTIGKAADVPVAAEPEVASQDVSPATEVEPTQTIQQPIEPSAEKIEAPKEEVILDSQKRKRRSLTPDISSEEASKKKMRKDDQEQEVQEDVVMTTKDDAEWVEKHDGVDPAEVNADAMEVDSANAEPTIVDVAKEEVVIEETNAHANEETRSNIDFNAESPNLSGSKHNRFQDSFAGSDTNMDNNMAEDPIEGVETDRMISPAIHSATKALYIRNFMRPLNTVALKEYLARLATPPSSQTDLSIISEFHMDVIRTHAFVCFSNVSAASRVRSAIHDTTWPQEKNRQRLWADFIPADKVRDWIQEEKNTTGRRGSTGKNWEVAYEDDGYGSMVAVFRESDPRNIPARQMTRGVNMGVGGGMGGMGRMGPPPPVSRNNMNANNIPLGPRSYIPLDPNPYEKRNDMESRRPSNFQDRPADTFSRPAPSPVSNKDFMYTATTPRLFYQAVTKEVVNKRLENMDAITRQDYRPDEASKENNRYTFEDGDKFVDRGPEIFEGIRPPRGLMRPRGGERGGGGGGKYRGERPRRDVDRYATGGGGGRGGRRFSSGGGGGGGFRSDDGYRGGGVRRH